MLVLYLGYHQNREVFRDAGLPIPDQAGLTARIREAIANAGNGAGRISHAAVQRVRERYDWMW